MSEQLQIAVIGCGDISSRHFHAFRAEADRVKVIACCDTHPERVQKAVAECGNPEAKSVSDYRELLEDPSVQAVDLCLPHNLHAPAAVAFARAGKHILCEKPLALNPEECDAMIQASRETNVTLMHLEPLRISRVIETAAHLVREGRIGRMVGLHGVFAYWQRAELNQDWRADTEASGGGHLMDGGIHLLDAMRHLGGKVTGVQAMTAQFRPELGANAEDLAVVNLRYEEGHLGQMFACHATRGRGASPFITVFGTDGILSLDAFGGEMGLVAFDAEGKRSVLMTENSWHLTYERSISHFLDVVLYGETLRCTPQDGRENVRVVLAAYESARTQREISLS